MPPVVAFIGVVASFGTAAGATAAAIGTSVLLTGASFVVGQVARALTKKPASTSSPLTQQLSSSGRLITVRQAAAPRRVIYGTVDQVGAIITYLSVSGVNNQYLDVVVTSTGHEISQFLGMNFDGVLVANSAGTIVNSNFTGLVSIQYNKGTKDQTAFSNLVSNSAGLWTSSHRQRGCAGAYIRLQYDSTKFNTGIPNITFNMQGKIVYDPRDGSMKYSSNAVLCEADYLFNATFGLGAQSKVTLSSTMLSNSGLNNFNASQSVDGNVTTKGWDTSSASSGSYCHIDLGVGNTLELRRFRMYMSNSGGLSTYQIEYSDNDIAWTSANPWYDFLPDVIEWNEVEIAPNGAHRFWRIRLTNTPGAGPSVMDFDFWISDVNTAIAQAGANVCDSLISLATNTTLSSTITLDANPQWITPASMLDIVPGVLITIDSGGGLEQVTVIDASSTQFSATFAKNHSSGVTITAQEPAYMANGSFTTDSLAVDIIQQFNSSHGGAILYSAGQWGIYPAIWPGVTLNLTDDDLRGPLVVQTTVPHTELFNGVKGTFTGPSSSWQMSDFPPYQDPYYLLQDGNESLWKEVEFSFTISPACCQRLGKIALQRHRRQITITQAQFKLNAWQVQPTDVIQFTHSHFGWNLKQFEVLSCKLVYEKEQNGNAIAVGVDLTLHEIDSTAYDWNTSTDENQLNVPPTTIMPAPGTVGAPSGLTLTNIAITRVVDGVQVCGVELTWTAPADGSVISGGLIHVQHKVHSASVWIDDGTVDGATTIFDIVPLVDGTQYDFRLWAENISGAQSAVVSGTKIPSGTQLLIDTIGDGSTFYRPPQHITIDTGSSGPYNSSFEIFPDGQDVADGWLKNCSTASNAIGSTYSRSNVPYAGTYSQSLGATTSLGTTIRSRPIAVKPGTKYVARARTIALVNNTGWFYFVIDWYSDNPSTSLFFGADPAWLGSSDGGGSLPADGYVNQQGNSNAWTLWEITPTAPANAKFACVRLQSFGDATWGATLHVDATGWITDQIADAAGISGSTFSPVYNDIGSWQIIAEMEQPNKRTYGGKINLGFNSSIVRNLASVAYFAFFRDGVQISPTFVSLGDTFSFGFWDGNVTVNYVDDPAPGTYDYDVRCFPFSGGSLEFYSDSRFFQITEVG